MATYRELIDATLLRASLESGIDTQAYSDLPVGQIIQSVFDTLFDMYWWPEYLTFQDTSFALDGTTGATVVPVNTKVKRWIDLRSVWIGTCNQPLPRAPLNVNPTQLRRTCVVPDNKTVFKIIPANTTDKITISYRTKPNNFTAETDTIDLDKEMMVLGAAYDYVNSLGLNPGAEDKLQQKFQNRIQWLIKENMQIGAAIGPNDSVPTDWNWF